MKLPNCPNCGAPIESEKCPYCHTTILDFAALQIGEPTYVKFKMGDTYILMRLLVDMFNITPTYELSNYYDDCGGVSVSMCRYIGHGADIELHARAVMGLSDKALITVINGARTNCPNCGAAMNPEESVCRYCGVRSDKA